MFSLVVKKISTFGMQNVRKVAIGFFIVVMLMCAWLTFLDAPAEKRIDDGLRRALTSFATARLLNGVISVVQGTEVAFEPMGVGMNFAPGQILDPINDLVEHFSNLMLAASVAFGIQKMLINIGSHWLVNLALTLSALGWMFLYFRLQSIPAWLSKCLVVLLMTRFAIPIVVIGTDVLFQQFMANQYIASQEVIAKAPTQITDFRTEVPTPTSPPKEKSLFGKFGKDISGTIDDLKSSLNMKKYYIHLKQEAKQLQEKAELWVEHVINLIVIFILQTLILPLLLVWVFYVVLRSLFAPPRIQ